MQYVNFVHGESDEHVLHTAPVPTVDAQYLARIASTLRPMSEADYMNGPACILHTLAKHSYVLNGNDLYWCIEWDPGLIVVRFSPNGEIAWSAVRSPVPDFGGREATEADWVGYDEDADNPQYSLIFDPWDAQFDAQDREWRSFEPADPDVHSRFENALARVNELGKVVEERIAGRRDEWLDRCKQNLKKWCGDGIRVK